MRKKIKKSFEELLAENRVSIQSDVLVMQEIEDRVDKRIKLR